LSGVEGGADRVGADVSAPATAPFTTPERDCIYGVGVDNAVGVDKNESFADSCFMVVADSDLPSEWLDQPPQKEQPEQVQLSLTS
jgi:hypothetical protein